MKETNKTTKGLMLRSIEGVTTQLTSFLLQMILARILVPEDFGVVAILATFVNIANTMVNNGLGSALIQRKHIQHLDICTVFFIELGVGTLMYLLIFLIAPYVAEFYENPMITSYLRVFSLTILMTPFASIQITVGRYRLDFRPSLLANIAAVAVQAVVGVVMALNGFGVWALVISQVASYAVRAIMLVALTRWFPSLLFSWESFISLFSYSWKLFAGWMIGTLYQDAFSWIIGKSYDSQTLGYYTKGHSIPSMINRVVTQVTSAVMFPSLAKNQDDPAALKAQTRQMLSVSAAVVLMIMAGLAGTARSLIHVVLTDKWMGAVPVIQIMSIPLALNVINNANMQVFNALGRSDLFLKMEMVKRGLTIVLVLIFANINYYLMLASIGVGSIASVVVNTIHNRKLFGYRFGEYLKDLLPYVLCAAVLFAVTFCLDFVPMHVFLRLALQLTVCAGMFFGLIFSGALPAYKAIRNTLLGMLRKKK